MSKNAVVWIYNSSGNFQSQASSCMDYAKSVGLKVVDQYRCGGGGYTKNEMWDKLCRDADNEFFDTVITFDSSIITEDPAMFSELVQPLTNRGISIRYVKEGYRQSPSTSCKRIEGDRMTVEYKRKSPEELVQMMSDTMATHYEEKDMFHQMMDDVAEGCISTIVERNAIYEIDEQFERFVRENDIQSFDEIETERRFEVIEGEDGSVSYRAIQEYRKKTK